VKIVIAIDSFKGCASSVELARQIKQGIINIDKQAEAIICPIADGGEGTVEALSYSEGARLASATCKDPLGQDIEASYTILQDKTAVIEMASASGLPLVPLKQRDPSITTTFGTGDLIKDAVAKGIKNFIIGIGGSATNDAGIGMLRSLGFRFLDSKNHEISFAKDLSKIVKIDRSNVLKELSSCTFMIACDVNNPLYGKNGATHVYASQKGANQTMILNLDEQLKQFANFVKKETQKDYSQFRGSGAAGGLGFGFLAFLNAQLKPGIEIVLESLHVRDKIQGAQLVITGEGKIDKQSSMGKVLSGIGKICQEEKVPCIALTGNSREADDTLHKIGIDAYFSILDAPMKLEKAMQKDVALELIRKKTEQIFRLIKISTKN